MDWEGCEYESILYVSDNTLKHFSEFIIEYHKSNKKLMEKFRKAGFDSKFKHGRTMFAKRED